VLTVRAISMTTGMRNKRDMIAFTALSFHHKAFRGSTMLHNG